MFEVDVKNPAVAAHYIAVAQSLTKAFE